MSPLSKRVKTYYSVEINFDRRKLEIRFAQEFNNHIIIFFLGGGNIF